VCGLPSILVPYPYARDRHQDANAAAAAASGACEVIDDFALNGQTLADRVLALVRDPVRLARMSAATRMRGAPRAAEQIVAAIERLAGTDVDGARPERVVIETVGTPLRRRAA
jgi:UDP-N-acetylglucosamine--N-acetylmuramyl-(pentapeptide) pyrophosphoryl-undecaprenol N-acetylglucosamine transferase